jgi:O-antigen/teichoic acid export membrane protein
VILKQERDGYQIPTKEILKISLPILVAALIPVIASQGTLWLLGVERPSEEVAIYGIVIKFATLISTPTLLYRQVVAPFIAEFHVQNRRTAIEKMMRSVASLTFILAVLLSLILFFFGEEILGIVYGEFYREGALALTILLIAQLINVATGPCSQVLLMTGNQQVYMMITFITGILALVISYSLIPSLGYEGAAIGQATFITLANLLAAWIAYRRLGIKSWIGIKSFF